MAVVYNVTLREPFLNSPAFRSLTGSIGLRNHLLSALVFPAPLGSLGSRVEDSRALGVLSGVVVLPPLWAQYSRSQVISRIVPSRLVRALGWDNPTEAV